MTAPTLLITQCLQNDFVAPIKDGEALPNLLHIGHEESRRLLGDDLNQGPISQMVAWAQDLPEDTLHFIHIRDWHDATDTQQQAHLQQFGEHCIAGTHGADFVFQHTPGPNKHIINSTTLNDFEGTELKPLLDGYSDQHANQQTNQPIRVGITGVWTEAKIYFLAYELSTRYPQFELAICSALTASSSRSQHFAALEQLKRIVGIRIIDSLGEFIEFLGGTLENTLPQTLASNLTINGAENIQLQHDDEQLLRYLYRDCSQINVRILDGGFSGNLVTGITSIDLQGREQAPHVIKIGPRDEMAKERTAFEQIETVLGNNAPAIADYADVANRGAIKYRYASMGGNTTTLQDSYINGADITQISAYLKDVYETQLGRFYRAAVNDKTDLLDYYEFSSKWADSVKSKIETLIGHCPEQDELILPSSTQANQDGKRCPNLYHFYKQQLDTLPPIVADFPVSYVHGDLNGANIIIDGKENVWLIDFFHTHKGHVLKDFAKLENDLLYIYTPINTDADLDLAYQFTDFILGLENPLDVNKTLPDTFKNTQFEKTFATIKIIRSIAKQYIDKDSPMQKLQWLIPQLRYAVHTIGFDEPNERQRVWALNMASEITGCIEN